MPPERWAQIEQIVQLAMDRQPAERAALLEEACGNDAQLRREVESLLASHEEASFRTDSGFVDAIRVLEECCANLSEGRNIGAYRLLREIGRGGTGNVYLAARADHEFEKLVAIKILRRGLDLDDVVRRFRGERQILAMLDHPNIARLLDGGVTVEGLPYFVMEYIEGEPIDQYCEQRNLSVSERLRLFQRVCSAVSYAHQNLIVHRDIKPANVIVTKQAVPRLLDFGIAKLLAPGAALQDKTVTGVRPLTPEYASPEQVRGEPITTASDIYSLGVLLYRLLTGHRPYRSALSSASEMERAICEEEPEKPSGRAPKEVRDQLKGDIDNIVLMALNKEPRRRYPSVEKFSEDIRLHLANLPIWARPATARYRAAKFIQRNKAWAAMAGITFFSLTGGIATSLWQTHVARKERDLARVEQAKSARINAFLQEMVGGTWRSANQKGLDATVGDMLEDAAQRLETELADQPEVKGELLNTIGGAYERQAKYDLAARYLHKAYDLNVKLYGPDARQTASVMQALASLAYLTGDYVTADGWFQKALPIFRRHTQDVDFEIRLMAGMLSDAAFAARARGRFDEAERLWRESLAYAPRLPARYRSAGVVVKTFLAQLYVDRGDVEKADPLASEAARELRPFGDRASLAQSLIDLGAIRRLEGRYAEAEAAIQEGSDLYTQAQGRDNPNVAYGRLALAAVHYDEGRLDLAEQDASGAQEIIERLPRATNYHAALYGTLGRILNKEGRSKEAERLLREAVAIREKSPRQGDLAATLGMLGECLVTQKRYAEAEPLLVRSYQILKTVQVPRSPALTEARTRLTSLYAAWGKPTHN